MKKSVLILMILLSIFVGASAAETAKITVGDYQSAPGETVDVKINLENNTVIAGGGFVVEFNPEILEIASTANGIISSGGFGFINPDYGKGQIMVGWAGLNALPAAGELCTIKFNVLKYGYAGIKIKNLELNDAFGDATDAEVKNGGILAAAEGGIIYGDVYMDYTVDIKDAQRLYGYIVGSEKNLTEYETAAADVYKDGTVDIRDAQRMAQYLADFSGIVLGE